MLPVSLRNPRILAGSLVGTTAVVCIRAGEVAIPWPIGLFRVFNDRYVSKPEDYFIYVLTVAALSAAGLSLKLGRMLVVVVECVLLLVLLILVGKSWSRDSDAIVFATAIPFGCVAAWCAYVAAITRRAAAPS